MRKTIPYVSGSINPVGGCVRYSRGCLNCYGFAWATRFRGGDFSIKYFPDKLDMIRRKKSGLWFVGSMTDLFQDEPLVKGWTEEVFAVMSKSPAKFLVLTKRAENMAKFCWFRGAPENIGIGVTAEGQAEWDERVPILLGIKAAMRWVSVEPMLEAVNAYRDRAKVHWIIAGPETGIGKRPCQDEWITAIESDCEIAGTPFFDKRMDAKNTHQWPKGWAP